MPYKTFEEQNVRGFLHEPEHAAPAPYGVALTHGAGADCGSPLLIAIADTFAKAGAYVLRFDLWFRRVRASGPPLPRSAAEDRASIRDALAALRAIGCVRLLAAGHSYGGRQASMLAAEDAAVCDGLLLLSYPLHPPKKPDDLRTAHFAALKTPALFVHGTRDPFGSVPEMRGALALITAATSLSVVERAGHDLARGKFDHAALILEPFRDLFPLLYSG